jgi:hypothetical protein
MATRERFGLADRLSAPSIIIGALVIAWVVMTFAMFWH